ncbi:MAG: hypothetical protein WC455_22625 [Dehalococcoidia bacterium]|jgi:hypothetical protein
MGSTNFFGHEQFNKVGSAAFRIYDSTTDAYIYFGRTTAQSYRPETDSITQQAPVNGVMVETQRRITGTRGVLSLTFSEMCDPKVVHLLFGDKAVEQTLTASGVVASKEQRTLYNTKLVYLRNQHGFLTYANTGSPTFVATPDTGTGSIAAATYYVWVQQGYGTGPTISTFSGGRSYDNGTTKGYDLAFTAGSPSDEDTATAGYQGKAVTVASTGHIDLVVTHHATAPAPDFIMVWGCATDSLAAATLIAVATAGTGTTNIICATAIPGTGDTYAACTGCGVAALTAYNATAASNTGIALVDGTDYTFDGTRGQGTLKRITTGTISDGAPVLVVTWNIWPAKVADKTGSRKTTRDTRKVELAFFEEEPDYTSTVPMAEGLVLTLYAVDVAALSPTLGFNETDFYEGTSVDLNCMYDQTEGALGLIEEYSDKFKYYLQSID